MPDFHDSVPILVVTGPTATGKTRLAVALARKFDGEIVSADSRQVYRGMDIGSGKDLAEYGDIPHHLIDIADPARETYHLGRFCRDAWEAIGDIADRGKVPVVCGGTALYLAALLDGYRLPGGALPPRESGTPRVRQDPDAPDSFRPPFRLRALVLGVLYPRQAVRQRIEQRLDARLNAGMVEEVRRLHEERGVSWETLETFGLEYREVARFLRGECDFTAMRTTLLNRIRQFAKRQDIFFRKLEREGHRIHWLNEGKFPDPFQLAGAFLRGEAIPEPAFRLCDHRNPPSLPTKRPGA
ncbi:MAG: tRNA (adenosine(37)-N6)-dimethylallyltransferase MiaA [Lentisphaeria bacterium]|nr:tRNA (adenosine(37)-N6)-dimethylallyltransferase MiaA [Lentisphaeria bacterium]